MGTFAGLVLYDVFGKDPGPDRLIDVILAYLLVGATYAFVYEAMNVAVPGRSPWKDTTSRRPTTSTSASPP